MKALVLIVAFCGWRIVHPTKKIVVGDRHTMESYEAVSTSRRAPDVIGMRRDNAARDNEVNESRIHR